MCAWLEGAEEALATCDAQRLPTNAPPGGNIISPPLPPPPPQPRAPKSTQDGYFSDFKLCISTPDLVQLMAEFGHQRLLLIDATFGTNDMKVKHHDDLGQFFAFDDIHLQDLPARWQ